MLVTSIFSFSHIVLKALIIREIIISARYDLLSANTFNLNKCNILLFGKEFNWELKKDGVLVQMVAEYLMHMYWL